jgi:uncharacterized membrane protein YhaH (DUF805 family)
MFNFWFSPMGRAARADYWYWLIAPSVVIGFMLIVIGPFVLAPGVFGGVMFVALSVFLLSHTILCIKRLHDMSLSGIYALALIIPALGAIWIFLDPHAVNFAALSGADDQVRLAALGVFALVFGPFMYVLGLIWFVEGKDGVNRYGRDPLYR